MAIFLPDFNSMTLFKFSVGSDLPSAALSRTNTHTPVATSLAISAPLLSISFTHISKSKCICNPPFTEPQDDQTNITSLSVLIVLIFIEKLVCSL